MRKEIIYLILIIILKINISNIYGLPGSKIIENAEEYLTWVWYCNPWNVREENRDGNPDTNNYKYPFWPEGEPIGTDSYGNTIYATGWNTGVAYAWGLREKIEIYEKKLKEKKIDGSGYLAGNHETKNKKNKIGRRKKWERLR